jgi:hypothetical protein
MDRRKSRDVHMPISASKFASSSEETTGGLQPVNDFLDVRILGMARLRPTKPCTGRNAGGPTPGVASMS